MMHFKERAACMQSSINEPPLKDFLCQKGGQNDKEGFTKHWQDKKSAGLPVLFGIFA